MKIIRFIIILMLTSLLLLSEFRVFDFMNMESKFVSSNIKYDNQTSITKIKEDLESANMKSKKDAFVIVKDYTNLAKKKIDIYGTSGVEEYFNSKYKIKNNIYKSMLTGNITITFYNINDFDDFDNNMYFYFTGDVEYGEIFKDNLSYNIDTLGIRKNNSDNIIEIMTGFIYIALFGVFLSLNLYDLSLSKKEMLLKIVNGSKIWTIVLKNIIVDFFILWGSYIIALLILKKYVSVGFSLHTYPYILLIIFLFNVLLNVIILNFDYKDVYRNSFYSKKILFTNYAFKVVITAISVLLLISGINAVNEGVDFKKQRSFIEEYKNYNYANYNTYNVENITVEELSYRFYKKSF